MAAKPKKLTCPKCSGLMRTYARNGITIDQCTACHGIFLDRGELEQLITAESSYLGGLASDRRRASGLAEGERSQGFLGELFDEP
jgi:Zn-finger nucleic acid-binding protein